MNVVGAFMWVSVGATALHYWQGYMADHDHQSVVRERTVSINCQVQNVPCRTDKMLIEMNLLLGWFGAGIIVCITRSTVRR